MTDTLKVRQQNYDHFHLVDDSTGLEFGLYKINLYDPESNSLNGNDIFVLAESEDAAIQQANCGNSLMSNKPLALLNEIFAKSHAKRIPFRIRGWSHREF